MLERGKRDRNLVEFVVIDQLVPAEHLLRKIDAAVDFDRIYEMVDILYSEDNGRPSVDPVVLFKVVLIQHLYGLPSLRRTADEISANICYRWFLGYTLQEETPHFSTVSYNFRHRFTAETVDQVFAWILEEVAEAGYLSPKAVFIDGTHIKANANTKKRVKAAIPAASKHYAKELMEEVNADREARGKKPFEDDDEPPNPPKKCRDNTSKKKLARRKKEKTRIVTQSVTDPDCGLFVKGSHERQFAYEAHTACDKNGFVLETVVTPGNVHDSVAFDEVYDKVTKTFPETETIVADSAYKTPHICKKVFDDGRVLSTAYKRPQTTKGGHEWWRYVYDEFYDCVICPEYQILKYATTNRDGCREYKSFVGVLHHEPFTLRALHTLLVFVGDRSGAKPNRVSEVDLIVQNAGDAVGRPQAWSGGVQSSMAFPGLAVVGVGRVHHLLLGEDGGDPLGAVSSGAEGEDALHHRCGVLVRNQRVGVTITFPIAVGRSAAQPLSLLRFHFHDRADLAAGILGVKLVGPVADGVEVIAALHCGIHAIVDSDEADILLGKIYLHVVAHLKVFTPQAGGVLYDEVRHLSCFDHLYDLFP